MLVDRTVNTEGQSGRELWSKRTRMTMMTMIATTAVIADRISQSHQSWSSKAILDDSAADF